MIALAKAITPAIASGKSPLDQMTLKPKLMFIDRRTNCRDRFEIAVDDRKVPRVRWRPVDPLCVKCMWNHDPRALLHRVQLPTGTPHSPLTRRYPVNPG